MVSSSGPVTALGYLPLTSPSIFPMAMAVSLWSPVIIATRTPAPWASLIACTHSGRGGSMMAHRPTIVSQALPRPFTNSGPNWSPEMSLLGIIARQSARTRRPWALRIAIWFVQYGMSRGSSSLKIPAFAWWEHKSAIRSGAPLTYTTYLSSSPDPSTSFTGSCTVAMNLYSELNGTSATTGDSFFIASTSIPAKYAARKIESSVGFPILPSRAPSFPRTHLLQRIPPARALLMNSWVGDCPFKKGPSLLVLFAFGSLERVEPLRVIHASSRTKHCGVLSLQSTSFLNVELDVTNAVRLIIFWVSVPVLSLHTMVTLPSVSTAGKQRIIALFAAMLETE